MAFKMKGSPMARNYGAPFEHGTKFHETASKADKGSTVYAGHVAGEHDKSTHSHNTTGTAFDNPGDAPVAKNPDGSRARNPERSPEYLAEKKALDEASKAKVKASKKPSTDAVADPSRSPYKNHKEGHKKKAPSLPKDFYKSVDTNYTNKVGGSVNMQQSKIASMRAGKTTLVYGPASKDES
tara:strand:- start:27 stop:572 length:546 start_codon:yes stop_codon:yes gene_type:complete